MKSIYLLIFMFISPVVNADELDIRWFDVELYLFYKTDPEKVEQFKAFQGKHYPNNGLDLIKPEVQVTAPNLTLSKGCTSAEWAQDPARCNSLYQANLAPASWPAEIKGSITPKQNASISVSNDWQTSTDINEMVRPEDKGNQAQAMDAYLLTADSFEFGPHINKIENNSDFNSIIHLAWRQPIGPKDWSIPLKIYGGKDFKDEYSIDGKSKQLQEQLTMFDWGLLNPKNDNSPVWQLNGELNIYLDHYLYIETDLQLRKVDQVVEKIKDEQGQWQTVKQEPHLYALPLKQQRRVRSEQLHYFDHPAMGMLIQIRKLPQPQQQIDNQN
ncbi:CsiV family protein [Paraferrimonas sp. SM1919]|uniref:CsiV family protein n=1 Tax=Paraferrimonas sp. SM1919 TaxID=2662263 RepID=UPI0013CF92DB|nr:CsiV family protein [Paraferrimonas sp. SM1919]